MSDGSRQHLAQVARGGAIGLLGAAVSAASAFILVVVVTNRYPAHSAGVFFTATSAFLLLVAVSGLGSDTGLGRFMLRFEALDRRSDIPSAIRAAVVPPLVLSLVLCGVVAAFAGPIAETIGLGDGVGKDCLRALALVLPIQTVNALALAGTRAFGRMRATAFVDGVFRSGAQPVLALAVSFASTGLLALTLSWVVPYALASVASLVLFRRLVQRRGPYPKGSDYRAVRKEFWSFTWPRAITRIAQMAIQRLDIVIIAALRSPAEAAIYTAATRFVALGQIGTQAIQQVVQPKFTSLVAAEDDTALRDVYRISTAWSMAISWPIYLIVGCAPLAYLSLFGETYADEGVTVVILMMVAMLFGIATGPADVLLLMSGRSLLSLVNAVVALALDIALCFLLIPDHGITGAAIAWAVAVITRCTMALLQTRALLGVNSFSRPALVVVTAGVTCLVLPLVVLGLIVEVTLPVLLLALLVCLPTYAGSLYLGRGPLELTVMRELFRARRRKGAPDGNDADTVTEGIPSD